MQQLLLEHSVPSYTLVMYVGIVDIAQIVIKRGICAKHICVLWCKPYNSIFATNDMRYNLDLDSRPAFLQTDYLPHIKQLSVFIMEQV